MFGFTLRLAFAFSLTGIALADDGSIDSASRETSLRSDSEALEIMRDHVRSQMDWRSYFSNRMDVRRRALMSERKLRGQPSTAQSQ